MRSTRLLVLGLMMVATARADVLDVIIDQRSTADEIGLAYHRAAKLDFAAIAPKLLSHMSTHPVGTGLGPSTKEPWKEAGLSPDDRVACTLDQLWQGFTDPSTRKSKPIIPLMLQLLEHEEAGGARNFAILVIKSRLDFDNLEGTTLPEVVAVLDQFARNARYPLDLRRRLVALLFSYADPNDYLDLAMALTKDGDANQQAGNFCRATPPLQIHRLSPRNRAKCLHHCIDLLAKIDDGTGRGYFLAMQIGDLVGVRPVREGQGSFAPDQRLPQYQIGHGGLSKSFFQDTVNNAWKWWHEHKTEYTQ